MAFFKKGPPGKRGIGFGGFNLKTQEEAPPIQPTGEFSKQAGDKSPPRKQKEEPKKLTKLSEADYEEMRQYEAKQRRSEDSRSPPRGSRRSRSRSPKRKYQPPAPRRRSRSRSRSPQRSRSPRRSPEPPRKRAFEEAPAAAPEEKSSILSAVGDDDLLEYAQQQLEEEDSDDPLDAFMATVEKDIMSEKKKKVHQIAMQVAEQGSEEVEKGKRLDLDEDDQESYFKHMEENPLFVAPEDEDDLDVTYDEDGNPVYTPKKNIIIPLDPANHSEITYPSFGKDFYEEHEDIKKLSLVEAAQLRNKQGIKVSGHNPPKPVSSFAHFGFDSKLMAVIRKQEYTKPTPIQAQAIPAALSGRDVVGIARTGSGKTAAYVWPMIYHIMDQPELKKDDGPIAIILAPTRELCVQIHQECRRFGKPHGLRCTAAYGGGNMYEQEKSLSTGSEIVVATPGRLIDHIKKKKCPMTRVTYLVLDECDRMFEMGFEPQVKSICDNVRPDRQLLLFSATIRSKISRLVSMILINPIHIHESHFSANQDVTQIVRVYQKEEEKYSWLTSRLIEFTSQGSVLVFVTRKIKSEEIAMKLRRSDFEIGLLHGDMSQFERTDILTSFKKQEFRVLVATDVAARGLDIKEIKNVINYDVARDIDTHTHRVGRTGRAGEKGCAFTLVTPQDKQFAGDLVRHLESANQIVTDQLLDLANTDPNFKKGRHNPAKGSGKLRLGLGMDTHSSGGSSSAPKAISGPMGARQMFGGMNALGTMGASQDVKGALKANYMSRFQKASTTTQKAFLPEDKTFAKPAYAGFARASSSVTAKVELPVVTPPLKPPQPKKKKRWDA